MKRRAFMSLFGVLAAASSLDRREPAPPASLPHTVPHYLVGTEPPNEDLFAPINLAHECILYRLVSSTDRRNYRRVLGSVSVGCAAGICCRGCRLVAGSGLPHVTEPATRPMVRSSKCEPAFHRILKTGAHVLPIRIERHWQDSAASTPQPPRACCFVEAAARD
jgi:hypothetical protein